jgi:hypothetical protein
MMSKTRKRAVAICNAQIKAGRKVLKAKTRKQAIALLKKVPYTSEGDDHIEKGLAWWDLAQWWKFINPDQKTVDEVIEEKIPALRKGCIQKHIRGM